jgi:putative PIN family toxin of toxin-antitoxin system
VFDTNVLFSAVGWQGTPYQCVELARAGKVGAATCQELLDELSEKLGTKLLFTEDTVLQTLADLPTFLQVVPITGRLRVVASDPDDDKVIEGAVLAGATHLVTGDRRHLLPMVSYQGIQIVTPSEFLSLAAVS